MFFPPHGPFELPVNDDKKARRIDINQDTEIRDEFWNYVDSYANDLSEACGCYLFGLRSGGGTTPWYAGKTEKQNFKAECFQPRNADMLNKLVSEKTGTPVLFLLPKTTEKRNNFSKPSKNGHKDIAFLENYLIAEAINKNDQIFNKQNTNHINNLVVPGILNSSQGRPDKDTQALKSLLGK